jgi:Na+/phosphate symporter
LSPRPRATARRHHQATLSSHIRNIKSKIRYQGSKFIFINSTKSYTKSKKKRLPYPEHRTILREEEIRHIEQNGSDYHGSVYYLDILSEVERMGDYIINISQATTQAEA